MKQRKQKAKKGEYDVIIIGSGCAGYAAAMYSGRFNLKTLLLGDNAGGKITLTNVVENYPGFIRTTGTELTEKLRNHAMDYKNFVKMKQERVASIKKRGGCFFAETDEGREYSSKTIILATGTRDRKLNIPGEKEFEKKGVHSCALCDGPFLKGKTVGVVGGSDSAAKEAMLLTQWAKKVYIIYRGKKIRPEPINFQRVKDLARKGKIEIINNTNVTEIKGDKTVTGVILDRPYKGSKKFKLDGVFISIGAEPRSALAEKIGALLNEKKEIIINKSSQTNIKGLYAAGDVTDSEFKQAITGVAEAVAASYSAYRHITEDKIVTC